MLLNEIGWVYPVPDAPDGRRAVVSDGFHLPGAKQDGKLLRTHWGVDIMYRRPAAGKPKLPWQSKHYEVLPETPVVASGHGVVAFARMQPRGNEVHIYHGDEPDRVETGYMHLRTMSVAVGDRIVAGTQIGTVGWDVKPGAHGLAHLHFQVWIGKGQARRRIDPGAYIEKWRHVSATKAASIVPCPVCGGSGTVS